MRLLILSLFVFSAFNVYSQQTKTTSTFLPVRQGVVVNKVPDGFISDGIYISSSNDSCFAAEDGIIASNFDLSDQQALIIKKAGGTYVTYANLKVTSVSKGDLIKKGTFIGLLKKDDEAFKLWLLVTDSKGKIFSQNNTLDYISQISTL